MRVEWDDGAKPSFRSSVMHDQEGAYAVLAAIDALPDDPYPEAPLGIHRGGNYHRLHIGLYRVTYYVVGDVIAIRRVDKVL